jgi:hypothetical protein
MARSQKKKKKKKNTQYNVTWRSLSHKILKCQRSVNYRKHMRSVMCGFEYTSLNLQHMTTRESDVQLVVCVCVCVRERERVQVVLCVCVWERKSSGGFVCVWERESSGQSEKFRVVNNYFSWHCIPHSINPDCRKSWEITLYSIHRRYSPMLRTNGDKY